MLYHTQLCVILLVINCLNIVFVCGYRNNNGPQQKVKVVFSWKQIGYDFDGIPYTNSTHTERKPGGFHFDQEVSDTEQFFIQYNNVPIGLEVFGDRVFVTVPRRRYGIPSTLNYVSVSTSSSPLLKPYPDASRSRQLVSVYRPRVDQCGRLWAVDTGLLEVPGDRKQVQPPAIVVYDLRTDEEILRYELKDSDLVNERTSGGLTSITIDVNPDSCDDAYAYINDLATEGLIVFSMREKDSWRISDPSFVHDESALNFTVAGHTINWRDGLFSVALSHPDAEGKRKAFYHPLMSTQEFEIDTEYLKNKITSLHGYTKLIGNRGPLAQSGTHDYHARTNTLLYANVAQDAVACWNVATELAPQNVAIVAQDHKKLVYISDLKVIGDDVWVLVNQIPKFVYSNLDPNEKNYFIHKGRVQDLIRGTVCDRSKHKL